MSRASPQSKCPDRTQSSLSKSVLWSYCKATCQLLELHARIAGGNVSQWRKQTSGAPRIRQRAFVTAVLCVGVFMAFLSRPRRAIAAYVDDTERFGPMAARKQKYMSQVLPGRTCGAESGLNSTSVRNVRASLTGERSKRNRTDADGWASICGSLHPMLSSRLRLCFTTPRPKTIFRATDGASLIFGSDSSWRPSKLMSAVIP
jgi:hypothetical protein